MRRYGTIGLGSFGYYIARGLYEDGNEVIAIDVSREKVQAIEQYSTDAIVMDATDKDKLKALGLEECDAVVISTGEKISTSILACYYLKEIGVKRIMVKAADEDHGNILRMLGATEIIHPEKDMAARITRGLSKPNVLNFVPLEKGYNIIQAKPPEPFAGKTLEELQLRKKYGVYIIGIKSKDSETMKLVPPADYLIQETDTMIILGKEEDIEKIKELK
jgi:trk system potassium uptake protein TrkA